MKLCKGCNIEKEESEFEARRDNHGRLRPKCFECINEIKKKYSTQDRRKRGQSVLQPPPKPVGRTKTCFQCDDVKDLSDFPLRSDSADGHENQCKTCKYAAVARYKSEVDLGLRELRTEPEITDEGKVCRVCDTMKPLEEYSVRNDIAHGYRTECKECQNKSMAIYQKERIASDEDFKIRRSESGKVWRCIINGQSVNSLGIKSSTVRAFFEYKFQLDGGLSWNNYGNPGKGSWTIDHVIPLSLFDLTQPEEFAIAFNWKNTQPLRDNIEKKDRFRPEEYEAHIVAVKQFIQDNDLPVAEYQGLTEMTDWLRDNLRYGNNLTDDDVPSTSKVDDPQPSP